MNLTVGVKSNDLNMTMKTCTEAAYPGTLMLPAIDFQFSEARIEYSESVIRVSTDVAGSEVTQE